jgi:membrane protease YdiL (CAAX protease family)
MMGSFARGLLWSILATALFLGISFGAFYIAHYIGQVTVGWMSPVLRGPIVIAAIAIAFWVLRVRINNKPWAGMALPFPQPGRLLLGATLGVVFMGAIFASEYAIGWLHFAQFSTEVRYGLPRSVLTLIALIPSLGTGFSEELAFRGYVFRTLGERAPVWIAAIFMGIVFGLMHFTVPGFGPTYVFAVALWGLLFLAMRYATGSLWFPIGFHATYDWSQVFFMGIKGSDPSWIQFTQTGPAFWVGGGATAETGMLELIAVAVEIALTLIYGAATGRNVPWSSRLSADI